MKTLILALTVAVTWIVGYLVGMFTNILDEETENYPTSSV